MDNEAEFVKMIETGRDEYVKNYGQEAFRIQLMLEEAQKSVPDAEYILERIKHNDYDEKMLDSLLNLFLVPVLTDWKQFEEDEKKKQEEQENIQDSE